MKTEKDIIEDLFFENAICLKCHMKANYCKCDIGEPMLMLAQFEKAIKSERARIKEEIEKFRKLRLYRSKSCQLLLKRLENDILPYPKG